MICLFYLALLAGVFSLLSWYPLFSHSNPGAAVVFLICSFLLQYVFVLSCKKRSKIVHPMMIRSLLSPDALLKACYLSLTSLFLEAVGLWLYVAVFSGWRTAPFFKYPFEILFSWLDIDHASLNNNFFLYGCGDYIQTFSPNASNMGISCLLMTGLAIFSLLPIAAKPSACFKTILSVILVMILYLFVRTTFLIGLFLSQDVSEQTNWSYLLYFWHPVFSLLSFMPLVVLLFILYRKKRLETIASIKAVFTAKSFKENAPAGIGTGLCCISLVFLLFFVPQGREKQGRVLFDEYYSAWSQSIKPIDETWYGTGSTYNYFTFRKYLGTFFDVNLNGIAIEEAGLENYDVLILKIPTRPFSQEAVKKIKAYVNNGGSLWVIGDHTNVFGSTTWLNPLLKEFGMQFRSDAVYDNEHGSFNALFNEFPVKHPILHYVPCFLFATPCSIKIDNPAMKIVIPGETTKTYNASYTKRNFFPDTKPDMDINFGANTLLAAGEYGKGRVALFSDSTVFSNFFFFLPGKSELAVSIVNWLNHENSTFFTNLLFVAIFIAGLVISITACFKQKRESRQGFWLVIFSLVCISASLLLVNHFNMLNGKLPAEKIKSLKVGFVNRYCSFYLPYSIWKEDNADNYNTFYLWGQRVGAVTKYYFNTRQAFKECASLFLVLPQKQFSTEDKVEIDRYLQKGGKVLILDDGRKGSTANQLLEQYNIKLKENKQQAGKIVKPGNGIFCEYNLPVGTLEGDCTCLLNFESNAGTLPEPVLVVKNIGSGKLYIYGGVDAFSNQHFGSDGIMPVGEKKAVNELILALYKLAVGYCDESCFTLVKTD